jgi:hypothetical protein
MAKYAEKSEIEKIRAHDTWAYFRITKDEMADAMIKPSDKWAHHDYDDDFSSLNDAYNFNRNNGRVIKVN